VLLIQDRDIRVINEHTGELLRELVLDPARDYQPRNPPRTAQKPNPWVRPYADVLRHHTVGTTGFEPATP